MTTIVALGAPSAQAICHHPEPKLCARYFDNDTIATGRLISRRYGPDSTGDPEALILYTVRVDKVYKGQPPRYWRVVSSNTSARWAGDLGKRYVFFASAGQLESSCSSLDSPGYVNRIEKELRQLKASNVATIEGLAWNEKDNGGFGDSPAAGLALSVHGPAGVFAGTTDRSGRFSIPVPPGSYELPKDLVQTDYSHVDDPVMLRAGQCAQLELLR